VPVGLLLLLLLLLLREVEQQRTQGPARLQLCALLRGDRVGCREQRHAWCQLQAIPEQPQYQRRTKAHLQVARR
jgi:hypothetical protein